MLENFVVGERLVSPISPPPHNHILLTAGLPSAWRRSLTGWPCRNICTSLSQRVRVESPLGSSLSTRRPATAEIGAAAWLTAAFRRKYQRLARGGVKLADVGKFGIERFNNRQGFIIVQLKGAGIGKDDAFLVEAQVHRVGA
jgi:hypothetical protein